MKYHSNIINGTRLSQIEDQQTGILQVKKTR